jgi:hypothetical protein
MATRAPGHTPDARRARELVATAVVGASVMDRRQHQHPTKIRPAAVATWVGALGSSVVLAVACGGSPAGGAAPQAPIPPAPAASAAATPPASPTPDALDPDETRCGVDDGPVRIGGAAPTEALRPDRERIQGPGTGALASRDDDVLTLFGNAGPPPLQAKRVFSEMMPQPPAPPVRGAPLQVSIVWQGPGTDDGGAGSPLAERAARCAADARLEDSGTSTLQVRLASSGTALSTRTLEVASKTAGSSSSSSSSSSTSSLRKCLEAAACVVHTAPGAGTTSIQVLAHVKVEPPVFRGSVEVSLRSLDDQREGPPMGRRGRRAVVLLNRPPAAKAAFDAMAAAFEATARKVGQTCAERLPPADSFTLTGDYTLPPGNTAPAASIPRPTSPESYEQRLRLCLEDTLSHQPIPSKTGRPERLLVEWHFEEASAPRPPALLPSAP